MREQLLRVANVAEMFGVSKASIWNWSKDNPNFPKPAKLSPTVTVWKLSEINAYINDHVFAA